MLCPRLPFLPPRPEPGRGPSPGSLPSPPNPRGRDRAALRAPRPSRPQGRDGLTAQPPAVLSAGRCHPAPALLRAPGLSFPVPAGPAGGGGPAQPRVLTPPQERRRPPLDEPRRVGVCGRAWTRCPGRDPSSPGPAPALSSAVRAPVASGRRSQCPPAAPAASAAAPRLPSPRRRVPIPAPTSAVAAPTSQVTAADKPGRALGGAPGGPLPAAHTRRPWSRARRAPASPVSAEGAGEGGGRREATSARPSAPRGARPALRPRDPHPQALGARAPHTHTCRRCGMRLGRRGRESGFRSFAP